MNDKVTFTLSIEEANKVFKALSALPFSDVYELIGKLNEQANQQLSGDHKSSGNFISGSSPDIEQILK